MAAIPVKRTPNPAKNAPSPMGLPQNRVRPPPLPLPRGCTGEGKFSWEGGGVVEWSGEVDMLSLPTLIATRYLTPLREGSSLPALDELFERLVA
jgi:hypothetical protein